MPVTAKLSRKFYDQFGEDLANELVDWFNKVDETFRAQLRDLNEVNFQRFDAKVGERLAELRSELHSEIEKLRTELTGGLTEHKAAVKGMLAEYRAEVRGMLTDQNAEVRGMLADQKADLMRWMFGLWATQMLAITGLAITMALRP